MYQICSVHDPPVTRHLNIWSKYYSKVRAGILVMCLAWLEARKPESQSPGFASQAKPNSGLDRGLGFGLRLVKPKPGLQALAFTNKISCVDDS
jgi:hypothetical protein